MRQHEPNYSCQNSECATEISYPAEMLRMWSGQPICQGCWEEGSTPFNPPWHELPAFVPPHAEEIARLRAERDEAVDELKHARDRAQQIAKNAPASSAKKLYRELDAFLATLEGK